MGDRRRRGGRGSRLRDQHRSLEGRSQLVGTANLANLEEPGRTEPCRTSKNPAEPRRTLKLDSSVTDWTGRAAAVRHKTRPNLTGNGCQRMIGIAEAVTNTDTLVRRQT